MSRPKTREISPRASLDAPGASTHDDGPRLGALLRLAYHAVAERLSTWLVESGHADLQPTHSAAVQSLWGHPEGVRLTAMAQNAHVTKQTMGELVDHLEKHGYVQRVPDPDDRRATRIRLTKRGESFTRDARAFARRTETEFDELLGPGSAESLRTMLRRIHEEYGRTSGEPR
ncbi:MAG: MarR family transcriptional regulator [Polyangiales bacterium]